MKNINLVSYSLRFLKSAVFFASCFFCIQTMSQEQEHKLIGQWFNLYNSNNYIYINRDTMEIGIRSVFSYKQPWEISKEGVIISENNIDKIRVVYKYYFIDELLVIITSKEDLNHIDEIELYSKNINSPLPNIPESKFSVLVEPGNFGLKMIYLPNFDKEISTSKQNTIILNSSFVESEIPISSKDYVLKNFDFFLNGVKLPLYIDNEVLASSNIINEKEKIVCFYGLNQIDRNEVNTVLNDNIFGNILFLYIGEYGSFKMHPSLVDF